MPELQIVYGHEEAVEASCIYFDGDELAAKVWANKYALKNSYGTQECYTGAGSYYSNYDLRTGKWDASVFTTWQDAVKYSIVNILLPIKYQSAQAQVGGIDVNYVVTFAYYDETNGTGTIKYQCTKSGPNPEFTYVQGPY